MDARIITTLSFFFAWVTVHAAPPRQGESFIYSINGNAGDKSSSKNIFVDLFDSSASRIGSLKKAGKNVLCYFSAGSVENWRPDAKDFPASATGKSLEGWAGEKWVDYRNLQVRKIMSDRIAQAKAKGCDGVDPDNIDGHLNKTGFSITSRDQKDYIGFLAKTSHDAGLMIGLKNSAETASSLTPLVDFAVVEECHKYKECSSYNSFANAKKAIFQIEYQKVSTKICDAAKKAKAQVIFANLDLTKFSYCK